MASKVIDAVVATFPKMSLHYYETCNGPRSREAVSKDGKLVTIDPWHVVVIMQNEDDYKSVVDYLKEKTAFEITQCTGATHRPQDPYSVGWQFDGNSENDLTTAYLNDLGRHFPEMLFQCYKYSDCLEAEGREIQYYAAFRGYEVNWEEPNPGLRALMQYSDYIDENITQHTPKPLGNQKLRFAVLVGQNRFDGDEDMDRWKHNPGALGNQELKEIK